MRQVTIGLEELLDLVSAAETYGYGKSMFYTSLFNFIGPLTNDEIEEFAKTFLTKEKRAQGYGPEDYEEIKERLIELRDKWAVV